MNPRTKCSCSRQLTIKNRRTHYCRLHTTAWFHSFFLRNISSDMECEVEAIFAFAIYHELSRVNLIFCPFPSIPNYAVEYKWPLSVFLWIIWLFKTWHITEYRIFCLCNFHVKCCSQKYFVYLCSIIISKTLQIFQTSRCHLKTLGARRAAWSEFQDPGHAKFRRHRTRMATPATWCPAILRFWISVL